MRVFVLLLAGLVLGAGVVQANPIESKVTYEVQGTVHEGLLVYDSDGEGKRPGVLVVHEWWGLNDYAKRRARDLAGLGYVALALDMYGGGKSSDHPKEAGEFSSAALKDLDLAA